LKEAVGGPPIQTIPLAVTPPNLGFTIAAAVGDWRAEPPPLGTFTALAGAGVVGLVAKDEGEEAMIQSNSQQEIQISESSTVEV
jgi:hypothetical protein